MKILHLFSNHKYTGPADPAMILAQRQIELGADVRFAASESPKEDSSSVRSRVKQRGIPALEIFRLHKHGKPWHLFQDVRRLRAHLQDHKYDVIHTHLANDHLIGALGGKRSSIKLFRTIYDASLPQGWRAKTSIRASHGLFCFGDAVHQKAIQDYPHLAVQQISPYLDLDVLRQPAEEYSLKQELGIDSKNSNDCILFGIVARMQTHRLFEELIEGFSIAAKDFPNIHLVVLGRGTNQEKVAMQPARNSGFADRIHFPGYMEKEFYPAALASLDCKIYMVPGSDGTCRAAREALAVGVPVLCTQRGLLPEIVKDGETGFLFNSEAPVDIAEKIGMLASQAGLIEQLGKNARQYADENYDSLSQARRVLNCYEKVVS